MNKTSNAMKVIHPYLSDGVWMFDDPAVGLNQEPFVAGIPEIIDAVVEDFADPNGGFNLFFSESEFPGHTLKLTRVKTEAGGAWYEATVKGMTSQGWLCPALLKYFEAAPQEIYVRAEERKHGTSKAPLQGR
jgi:hypothetical protein